jgi:hypothetical protein
VERCGAAALLGEYGRGHSYQPVERSFLQINVFDKVNRLKATHQPGEQKNNAKTAEEKP